jgi:hypothetical protein
VKNTRRETLRSNFDALDRGEDAAELRVDRSPVSAPPRPAPSNEETDADDRRSKLEAIYDQIDAGEEATP